MTAISQSPTPEPLIKRINNPYDAGASYPNLLHLVSVTPEDALSAISDGASTGILYLTENAYITHVFFFRGCIGLSRADDHPSSLCQRKLV